MSAGEGTGQKLAPGRPAPSRGDGQCILAELQEPARGLQAQSLSCLAGSTASIRAPGSQTCSRDCLTILRRRSMRCFPGTGDSHVSRVPWQPEHPSSQRAPCASPFAQHDGRRPCTENCHSSSGSGYCSGASPIALSSLGYLTRGSFRLWPMSSIWNCQLSP